MNIFYLDNDPKVAAEMHCDKHVVKMLVEYAQILSTAHRMVDGEKYIGKSKLGRKVTRYRLPDNLENIVYKEPVISIIRLLFNFVLLVNIDSGCSTCGVNLPESIDTDMEIKRTKITGWTLLSDILKHTPKNLEDKGFKEPPSGDEEVS